MNPIAQLQKFTKLVKQIEDIQKFDDEVIRIEKKKWRGSEFTYVYLLKSSYQTGWMIDSASNHCLCCQNGFTVFVRKHHCRGCGIIICNSCSTISNNVTGIDKVHEPKGSRICSKFCVVTDTKIIDNNSLTPLPRRPSLLIKNERTKKNPTAVSIRGSNVALVRDDIATHTKTSASTNKSKTDQHTSNLLPNESINDDSNVSLLLASTVDNNTNQKSLLKSYASDTTDISDTTIKSDVSQNESKSTYKYRAMVSYLERPPVTSNNTKFLGVKLSYFTAFIEQNGGLVAFKGKTTRNVCEEFIQLKCMQNRSSICGQLSESTSSSVGPATWFVSHTWSYLFLDTVDAITRKLSIEYGNKSDDVYIWFDLFSLPQLGKFVTHEYLRNTFIESITTIKNVMMVLSSWNDPKALKRAWCVYELFICKQSGGNFQVAFPHKEVIDVINYASSSSTLHQDTIFSIDTSKSEAGSKAETELIHNEIKSSIGFEALDTTVEQSIFKVRSSAEEIKLKGLKLEKEGKFELALIHYEEVLMLRSLLKVEKTTLLTAMIYRARVHLNLKKSDEMYIPVLELYKRYKDNKAIVERIHKHIKDGGRGIVSLGQLYTNLNVQSSGKVSELLAELRL